MPKSQKADTICVCFFVFFCTEKRKLSPHMEAALLSKLLTPKKRELQLYFCCIFFKCTLDFILIFIKLLVASLQYGFRVLIKFVID